MIFDKEFKRKIRRTLGLVPIGEVVTDPVEENTKARYDHLFKNAQFLKGYIEPGRLALYDEFVEVCNKRCIWDGISEVLDVGCGTGHLLEKVHRVVPEAQLVGVDFSDSSVELTRQTVPMAEVHVQNIYEFVRDFEARFDVVFCTEVLEHLLHPDEALRNVSRYVKPGGSLVLSVPDGRRDTYGGHLNFWSPESWPVFVKAQLRADFTADFQPINNGANNLAVLTRKK